MIKPFAHLHNHSSYSVLDGAAKIDEMVEAAVRDGAPGLGVTDHGVLYGLPEFYKACKAADINPCLGIEAYFSDDRTDKSPINDGNADASIDGSSKRYYHLTVLAESDAGYRNLMKLSSDAYLNGFYFKPRADWSTISEFSEGLIATSGCLGGPVLQPLLRGDLKAGKQAAQRLQDIFGKDSFYIELQDQGLPEQAQTNPHLIDIARSIGAPLVATNDSHYVHSGDAIGHDSLLCIQTGSQMADEKRFKFASDQHYLKTAEEMRHIFRDLPEACDNTLDIVERANVTLDFETLHLPHFTVPERYSSEGEYLAALAMRGLQKRGLTETGMKQLQYELSVVESLGLSAYFLIVWDIVKFADQQRIARGPGRGSVAGSLIAYCLNISKVDPLRHNLMFERFLNPSRIAMPDIDLDFSPAGREHIINYITEKYGSDQVAQIITYSIIRGRSAIRDAARVLGHPPKLGDTIAKMMPELIMGESTPLWACMERNERYLPGYSNADGLRDFYNSSHDAKEVIDVALGLEGLVRHTGTGAAGILITPGPVTDFVPIQTQGNDNHITTQYDKNVCEDLGLVKMDILGLRNLDVIAAVSNVIGLDVDSEDFKQFNDGPTFDLLRQGDTLGVFQLESRPIQDLLRAVNPNTIDDIAAVVALYRPGPMGSNMHNDYADRKNGRASSHIFHPDAEDILSGTHALMVYQEQAMQLAVRFAGYTEAEADNLRKIIGKKLVDKMTVEREKFVDGCDQKGYGRELGQTLFNMIESFASYGFNRSHAYAYAYISYQTAYLKAHYPVEFYAALCDSLTDTSEGRDKIGVYLNAAKNLGIEIVSPNVDYAEAHFAAVDGKIVVGLNAVKHLSSHAIETIIEERKQNPFKDIKDFVMRAPLNVRELQQLALAGGLDRFGTRLGIHVQANELVSQARGFRTGDQSQQMALFNSLDYWDIQLPAKEFDDIDRLHYEKEALGVYVSGNPLAGLSDYDTETYLADDFSKGEVLTVIMSVKKKKTRAGAEMATLVVSDGVNTRDIVVFPKAWREFGHHMTVNSCGILEITVKEDDYSDGLQYIGNAFYPVRKFEDSFPDLYEKVVLRVPRGFASNQIAVSMLKGILLDHSGNHPVVVQVSERTELDLKTGFNVTWDDDLKKTVADLFARYSADKRMKEKV